MGFLPARMTRLLVGGHQQHMAAAIDLLHAEGAVHLEDFEDPTGTTRIGSPLPAGAAASELLVKTRGLLKALGAEAVAPAAGPVDPRHTLAQAESATTAIVERASQHRADWAALESEQAALRPYAGLDVELSALAGLASVRVFVGLARSDPSDAVRAAAPASEIQAVASRSGFAVLAVVPVRDAAAAERALASAGFANAALPAGRSGTPAQRLAAIEAEQSRLQSALAASDADLARLRAEWAPRLASAERALTAEVEKTQAPLRFGTTASTFHVEGWVPRSAANRVKNALAARFGDSVYVEDLGDAPRGGHGAHGHGGPGGGHGAPAGGNHFAQDTHAAMPAPAEADAASPHGAGSAEEHHATDAKDEPPIHLENKGPARPYEFLLGLLGKPRYNEIDPTKLMLVFFPLFFGLMVGDLLVGLIIAGVGLVLRRKYVFGIGGPAVGRVLVMGGLAAALVGGVVFGEALGIHFVTPEPHEPGEEKEISWEQVLGLHLPDHGFVHKTGAHAEAHAPDVHAPDTEGGTPADQHDLENATSNATATIEPHQDHAEPVGEETSGGLLGMLAPHSDTHLVVGGLTLGHYSKIHDIQALLIWSILIGIVHLNLGFFLGVRNVSQAHGIKLAVQEKLAWVTLQVGAGIAVWGFAGGPGWALPAGAGTVVASIALLWMGAQHVLGAGFIAVLEVFGLVGNLLSYTRLAAIGASKAGMVIAFSAIGFETLGGGDVHSPVAWLVYLLGFVMIIVLSILAGSLQSLRLQFVEFFQKFYTGGGRPYLPFGRRAA
jgi:vacuolar-type H+-ATPase subunit I/STV1